MGRKSTKEGGVCTRRADSLCHPAETYTVKQLHSNKKFFINLYIKTPAEGNGNRGDWWAIVHGIRVRHD